LEKQFKIKNKKQIYQTLIPKCKIIFKILFFYPEYPTVISKFNLEHNFVSRFWQCPPLFENWLLLHAKNPGASMGGKTGKQTCFSVAL
jgi:hypothetical protein